MTKYSAIIVDDEIKLQEVIRIKLEKFCPQIEILAMAENVQEAYQLIRKYQPNIVFLDIAMPLESGFDLLYKFSHITFEVIFATGFEQYALKALKLCAVDYLLKPISTDELIAAVNKAIQNIQNRQKIARYEVLKKNLHSTGKQDVRISIPSATDHQFVKVSDIVRCEGWQKYTRIYLEAGVCILSSYNIGVFKEMLEPYDFYTTHRSHIINTTKIERYIKKGEVLLSDGSHVPVARRKKEVFYKTFIEKG